MVVFLWGSGGGGSGGAAGGAGTYLTGTLAVTPGQVLTMAPGQGGLASGTALPWISNPIKLSIHFLSNCADGKLSATPSVNN